MRSDSARTVVTGSGSVGGGVIGICTCSGDDGILVVTAGAREDVGVSSGWSGTEGSFRGVWARVESTVGVTVPLWYLTIDSQGVISDSDSDSFSFSKKLGWRCSPPRR